MKLPLLKTQLIIYLACFSAFLFFKDKNTAFLSTILISVIAALGFEGIFYFFKNKVFIFSESAVISGLIIGLVLSSDAPWWILVIAALFAIGSKYLIRFRQRHIFNPAALGIFLVTVIFGVYTQWNGAYQWYILAPVGLYFISKIRKLELLFSYFITALVLFGFESWMQKVPLGNIFGYLNYFFIFIMLIEPKTTPIKSKAKIIFGVCAAALIFIFTLFGARFDVELLSLLIVNITVLFINKRT